MIDSERLLTELQGQQKRLEKDLRQQADTLAEVKERLEGEYRVAREAGRTSETFSEWREGEIAQAAVAWVLGCVFLRFSEDNRLVAAPLLAGPGDANRQAQESARAYFRQHPTDNDRHYLLYAFSQLAQFPAVAGLYESRHNPLFRMPISTDAAAAVVEFWQQVNPDTGELLRDFTDPELDTRFLGNLYQDLSEFARKRYALLQTPIFVEEFILDRTLDPAIETFGLEQVRMIDPTCGSGHFLLGGFARINALYEKQGLESRERVKRALAAIYGVDINPFAVAIARFRLLIAALKATGIRTLQEAPGWKFNVTTGDSLLHGRRFGELDLGEDDFGDRYEHYLFAEDPEEINRILGQQYHAVVGNPPYVIVTDSALSGLYRRKYTTCYKKYSLGVPFTERFFRLTLQGTNGQAGFLGMITSGSFMKNDFGKKLIGDFMPRHDLSCIVDTRTISLPGHGTSTVVLFGRNRAPVKKTVRVCVGLKAEVPPSRDAAKGPAWTSLLAVIDSPGTDNDYFTSSDFLRADLSKHPWVLESGRARKIIEAISQSSTFVVSDLIVEAGFGAILGEDEAFVIVPTKADSTRIGQCPTLPLVSGDLIRDWSIADSNDVLFPYDDGVNLLPVKTIGASLWILRTTLSNRKDFSGTYAEVGRPYWGYHQIPKDRNKQRVVICFAEIVSHNHFALSRERRLFDQTAPILTLRDQSNQDSAFGLVAMLNSSAACFWLRQHCRPKGGDHVGTQGARVVKNAWEERFAYASTRVTQLPVITPLPIAYGIELDALAHRRPRGLRGGSAKDGTATFIDVQASRELDRACRRMMIAAQEELDWWCYRGYKLIEEDLCVSGSAPELDLGERAFEIVMARQMAAGELETTWFERHGSTPITELPSHWPSDYAELVRRRIALIESHPWISLLEKPEYKRRWNQPSWEELEHAALQSWLLDRLETPPYWPELSLQTLDDLVARAERDADFMAVAALYRGEEGFPLRPLMGELLAEDSVPALKVLRYKESGLRKRADWEQTWEKQRQEDAIEEEVRREMPLEPGETEADWETRLKPEQSRRKRERVGNIAAPPKYTAADFLSPTIKRLRGDLDVPKERFFSLPRGNASGEALYGWAGWDHAQRVRAIAGTYTEAETQQGWPIEQLQPLLVAVHEELPWVLQWHNEIDDDGLRLGDFFREWLGTELQKYGLTRESLEQWRPERATRARRRRA